MNIKRAEKHGFCAGAHLVDQQVKKFTRLGAGASGLDCVIDMIAEAVRRQVSVGAR